ncbi:MAG TPA: DUF5624 domain-containing protein [Candidatus Melainabacteria bacterium]|nr:DUF5624 domain-containing protein [Candidatus Melainabacteria bacterium]
MNRRYIAFLAALVLSLSVTSVGAEENKAVPESFMKLYHDFTGMHDGKSTTIGQELANALEEKERMGADGPLVLVVESGIYVYDHATRKLVAKVDLRSSDPKCGFIELTAISHVGPAIAYAANLKELGNSHWKVGLQNLYEHLKEARVANASSTSDNWLDTTSARAMQMRKEEVRRLIDYACYMAGDYIQSVLNSDGKDFTLDHVSRDFYNAVSEKYPVPYKNVMVGTFALVALNDAYQAYLTLSEKKIDWSAAKVLIQFHAGTNYGGGITKDSCHLYQLLRLISNNTLAEDRIFFTPYADQRPSIGDSSMTEGDFAYYTKQVWYHQYARPKVAVSGCFQNIDSIFLPDRPALPGDWGYSSADNIDDFMIRMKYSLGDNTQLLSNPIGFWMSGELFNKDWNPKAVSIPGLTAGFPKGVSSYPEKNPEI